MEAVCIIFARGGSKGLPGKNLKTLKGVPLIGWSIEKALKVKRINRVIVSTDSDEIASIAKKYGGEVPFKRPFELSKDNTPEWQAWKHALKYLNDVEQSLPEVMVSLPTTSPLRQVSDIEACLDEYEKSDADIVVTITDSHRNPYFNMVKKELDGTFTLVNKTAQSLVNRQSAPEVFDLTTVCYVVNCNYVLANSGIFQGKVKAVTIPPERAIDIDTEFDFQVVEALVNSGRVVL